MSGTSGTGGQRWTGFIVRQARRFSEGVQLWLIGLSFVPGWIADGLRWCRVLALPPGQVYFRSRGRVSFVALPRGYRIVMWVGAASTVGWIAYSIVYVASFDWRLEHLGRQVVESRLALDRAKDVTHSLESNRGALMTMLESVDVARLVGDHWSAKTDYWSRSDGAQAAHPGWQGEWSALAGRQTRLESEFERIEAAVTAVVADYGAVTAERDRLNRRVDTLAHFESAYGGLTSAHAVATAERDRLRARIQTLTGVEAAYEKVAALHRSVVSDRDSLRRRRDALQTKTDALESSLAILRTSQMAMLERLARSTEDSVRTAERVVGMAGMDVEALLARERFPEIAAAVLPAGRGGPYLALSGAAPALDLAAARRIEKLDMLMDRWHSLRRLLDAMPITSPVDHARLSSGFGPRRDPIRKRWARHDGIDLANFLGTVVRSPASGRVVYAGWRGNFGRTVEIDHGFGIRTRYGHLKKILVVNGQDVDYRDRIGLMGSTGRSTGSHLHYEVRVDGKSVNPLDFLQAGKYVLKAE